MRCVAGLIGGVLMSVLLLALSAPMLEVRSSFPRHVDAVMVLSGSFDRMEPGITVFKQTNARWLLLSGALDPSGYSWGRWMLRCATDAGIPSETCVVDDRPHSTYTNFSFMMPEIRKRHLHDVVIVTNWYHSRRSLWVARALTTQQPAINFYSYPSEGVPPLAQRFRYRTLCNIGAEWGKMVWYGFRHQLYF